MPGSLALTCNGGVAAARWATGRYSALDKPCATKGFFKSDEATLEFSPSGRTVSIKTFTESTGGDS